MHPYTSRIRFGIRLASIALLGLAALPAVYAQTITIGAPGDPGSGNSFPFTVNANGRYEQVYNAALFTGPINIGQISFFNTQFNPGTAVVDTATYAIHLSTTSRPVNGLDVVNLNNNDGPNDAVFFNGTLGGAVGPSNVFTISGTPFLYNPAGGNLLIDIFKTNQVGNGVGFLDARNGTFGTDSSRAHNFGSGFEGFGLVTRFGVGTAAAVPEPGTVALLGSFGVTGSFLAVRRLRRR